LEIDALLPLANIDSARSVATCSPDPVGLHRWGFSGLNPQLTAMYRGRYLKIKLTTGNSITFAYEFSNQPAGLGRTQIATTPAEHRLGVIDSHSNVRVRHVLPISFIQPLGTDSYTIDRPLNTVD
jgi:hypothetical protein